MSVGRGPEKPLALVEQMECSDKFRHKPWTHRAKQRFFNPRTTINTALSTLGVVVAKLGTVSVTPQICLKRRNSKLFYLNYGRRLNVWLWDLTGHKKNNI
ncbi:hypothetical protein XENORESO_007933 [Xenotaenia resolanae]|uniref:Uncharacterized protein n=1 Tax=Xenotaenia resolanae TaxID=208358 RepID=A0ABV0VYP9_9TELE